MEEKQEHEKLPPSANLSRNASFGSVSDFMEDLQPPTDQPGSIQPGPHPQQSKEASAPEDASTKRRARRGSVGSTAAPVVTQVAQDQELHARYASLVAELEAQKKELAKLKQPEQQQSPAPTVPATATTTTTAQPPPDEAATAALLAAGEANNPPTPTPPQNTP